MFTARENYPMEVSINGTTMPLAMVYKNVGYYFDIDAYDDAASTVVKTSTKTIIGLEANKALIQAIHEYDNERKKIWFADWFRELVVIELGEQETQS